MRCLTAAAPVLAVLALAACGSGTPKAATTTAAAVHRDPNTTQALLRIARTFNDDFSANRVGPVYDRWDAQSKAIISRASYIRRHEECPRPPGRATILGVEPDGDWWLVHYEISDVSLTDYWHYEHGRWVFDLIRSNPDAVRLYRLPAAKYIAAIGCKP